MSPDALPSSAIAGSAVARTVAAPEGILVAAAAVPAALFAEELSAEAQGSAPSAAMLPVVEPVPVHAVVAQDFVLSVEEQSMQDLGLVVQSAAADFGSGVLSADAATSERDSGSVGRFAGAAGSADSVLSPADPVTAADLVFPGRPAGLDLVRAAERRDLPDREAVLNPNRLVRTAYRTASAAQGAR